MEVLLLLKDLQGLLSLLEHVLLFDKSLWSQRLLWLLGSKEKLLLELVQEQLLLGLILLVYFSRRVVLLLRQVLFLQQLENSLGIDEIYDVILISSLIPLGPSQKIAGRPFGANSNCFEIGRPSPPMASLFMAEEPVCIAMVEFGFASGVSFA